MSKDGNLTLKQLAALRIEEFTKHHTRYEEAMKLFNKMVSSDNKRGGEKQGLYPMGLTKVSQEIHDGILAYCTAAKLLASDYVKFYKDPHFCKRYHERVEYIDIIKEDLAAAMQTLHDKLSDVPIYVQNLSNGNKQINALNNQLDVTKHFMQVQMNNVQASIKTKAVDSTTSHEKISVLEANHPRNKSPHR